MMAKPGRGGRREPVQTKKLSGEQFLQNLRNQRIAEKKRDEEATARVDKKYFSGKSTEEIKSTREKMNKELAALRDKPLEERLKETPAQSRARLQKIGTLMNGIIILDKVISRRGK